MICAGEPSGDLHGAALVREALAAHPGWSFFGLGGDLMAEAGVSLKAHIRETAVMGGSEVVFALSGILKARSKMLSLIKEGKPDCVVLVDYPDFNLRIAKAAKAAGAPVVYYICPTVWAWRPGRLYVLRDRTTARCLIFGFEADYYRARGVDCDFVGHPLFDEIPQSFDTAATFKSLGLEPGAPLLALLPGSRKSVASRLAPPMLGAADLLMDEFPGLRIAVPMAPSLPEGLLASFASRASQRVRDALVMVPGRSQEILAASRAALLASGTSSVEGAILGIPMVSAWRFSLVSWLLAKLLVKTPYSIIPNIISGREIVPDLLQSKANPRSMADALAPLIRGGPERERMLEDLKSVVKALGGPGASAKVAAVLERVLESRGAAAPKFGDGPGGGGSLGGGQPERERPEGGKPRAGGLAGGEPGEAKPGNERLGEGRLADETPA
jgi:lipid-A-disaccharide synthase